MAGNESSEYQFRSEWTAASLGMRGAREDPRHKKPRAQSSQIDLSSLLQSPEARMLYAEKVEEYGPQSSQRFAEQISKLGPKTLSKLTANFQYGIAGGQKDAPSVPQPPGGRPSTPVAPPVQDAIPEVGQEVIKGIPNPGPGEISSTLWGVPDAAAAGGVAAGAAEGAGAAVAGGAAAGAAEGAAVGSVVPGIGTLIGAAVGAAAAGSTVKPTPVPAGANAGSASSFRDLGSAAGYAFGSAGGPLGSSVGMTIGGLAGKWLGGEKVTGAEVGKSALSIAGGAMGGNAGKMIGSAIGGLFEGNESGGGGGGGGATVVSGASEGDPSEMTRLLREMSINIRVMVNDGIVIRGDHRQAGGSKI